MSPKAPFRVVVLAAGYGTRLGDLGRHTPKLLLDLGGRPLADHLLDGLGGPGDRGAEMLPEEVVVVTNSRFLRPIEEWAAAFARRVSFPLRVLDDGTSGPEEQRGAVGDLAIALEAVPASDDLLVVASDTLPGFALSRLVEEWRRRPAADLLLVVQDEPDPEVLGARGVVSVDPSGRVAGFQEKPTRPRSSLTALPLYVFGGRALALVPEYLETGGSRDAPGHLVAWLVDRVRAEAWASPGARRMDVGTPEGLRAARRRHRPGSGS